MSKKNDLLMFNSEVLLNKREILESFSSFLDYMKSDESVENHSFIIRKTLLALGEDFKNLIMESDIPTLYKPWYFYEYEMTNDSINLTLNKASDVKFDEEEEYISEMNFSVEQQLLEVKCKYLTVEEYANYHGVTTTTVRQWIRRGKLRSAKKNGRNWLIPELADKPKRGFESVTYHWSKLEATILDEFPNLLNTEGIYIFQDEENKKQFYGLTRSYRIGNNKKISLTIQQREKLELLLISSDNVEVDRLEVMYHPIKKNFDLPILNKVEKKYLRNFPEFSQIFVTKQEKNRVSFFLNNDMERKTIGSDYIIPIELFFSIGTDQNDGTEIIGSLYGNLILCKRIIAEDVDLRNILMMINSDFSYLVDQGGPLNTETGDSMLNVLCINSLKIEKNYRDEKIDNRILQELPYLIQRLFYIQINIIVEASGTIKESSRNTELRSFYKNNGFQELNNSDMLYAYVEY